MKTHLRSLRVGAVMFVLGWLIHSSVQAGEVTTYYHLDGLGSTAAATDSAGTVKWLEEYTAYGTRIRQPGTADNNLGYTGKFHDEDTGLIYFGARWYDPVVGRFMSVDPAQYQEGNVHSFNRYAYANNNPHRFVDPDGRVAVPVIVAAVVWTAGAGLTVYDTYTTYRDEGATAAAQSFAVDATITALSGPAAKLAAKALGTLGKSGVANTAEKLTAQQLKSISSYEKRILEHQEKLEAFKANPTIRPGMENLPKEVIEKQWQRRIDHLETEIRTFNENIEKIKRGELGS